MTKVITIGDQIIIIPEPILYKGHAIQQHPNGFFVCDRLDRPEYMLASIPRFNSLSEAEMYIDLKLTNRNGVK